MTIRNGPTVVSTQLENGAGLGETPFRASIALREGMLKPHALYRDFTRVYRDVYVSKGIALDSRARVRAAWLFSGGRAVLGGYSAATFHNTKWIADDVLPELIWPHHRHRHPQLLIRTDKLPDEQIMTVEGMRITTPVRTAMDLGCRLETDDAIVALDALCAATSLDPQDISDLIGSNGGARGIVNLRRILKFVDSGAESPQETHTRLLLIRAGLPAPSTQIRVRDQNGIVFARCDMGWEKWKVSVEYDGKQHWDNASQRAGDIDRQNLLENLGWRVVRVSARQLKVNPQLIVGRARQKLCEAGALLEPLPKSTLCELAA